MDQSMPPIKRVEKLWGYEEWIENNELYCLKRLVMKPGWQSSLHKHLIKDETFFVLASWLILEIESPLGLSPVKVILKEGQSRRIPPNTWHRFSAPFETFGCMFFEASTRHDDTDVVRL
jgi:mannose-6-phosphate isomerase-like protein (cupin superfamily)